MKVISIWNIKGGVGKTTLAYHLAWGLFELGSNIDLLDLDPQGDLSATFGIRDKCSASEIFSDKPNIFSEVVVSDINNNAIRIVTSNIQLAKAEVHNFMSGYRNLSIAISNYAKNKSNSEYLIIDCPPSLSLFTFNAFTASDYVLIPSLPYYYSLLGLKHIFEIISNFNVENRNSKLKIIGVIINQTDRTIVARESSEVLEENFGDLIFRTKVPKTIRVEEALQAKMPVWKYEPENAAGFAFKEFVDEFLQRMKEA